MKDTYQVYYMAGSPFQHPDVRGRELPLKPCNYFSELEAVHLFLSAQRLEGFFEHEMREQSFHEAFDELMEDWKDNATSHIRMERRIRSYILEIDIFLKHWEKFLGHIGKSDDYTRITSQKFDSNDAYALVCTLRNYLVHSGDLIHRKHVDFKDRKIFAERDFILHDFSWPCAKKALISRQEKYIDLIQLAENSFPACEEVHHELLKLLVNQQLKDDCNYMLSMQPRTILVNATKWVVIKDMGTDLIQNLPGHIGVVPGIGVDIQEIIWNKYVDLKKFICKIDGNEVY